MTCIFSDKISHICMPLARKLSVQKINCWVIFSPLSCGLFSGKEEGIIIKRTITILPSKRSKKHPVFQESQDAEVGIWSDSLFLVHPLPKLHYPIGALQLKEMYHSKKPSKMYSYLIAVAFELEPLAMVCSISQKVVRKHRKRLSENVIRKS